MSLPNPHHEAVLFWQLRATLVRSIVRQALTAARLRTSVILSLTIIFWGVMYSLFVEGFGLIRNMVTHLGTRVEISHAVFNVFFLALSAMLMLSTAVILYSTAYRGREVNLLLTLPVRIPRIVLYKLQEAMFVACWGFFLLGGPMLIAYGVVAEAPWYYYALLPLFMLAFVTIPCSIGGMLCLLVTRIVPRGSRTLWWLLGLSGLLLIVGLGYLIASEVNAENMMSIDWFQTLLSRMQYSERRILPSWWLSTGLLEAAHPAVSNHRSSIWESLGFLSVLSSNAMLTYSLLGTFAGRWYLSGRSAIARTGATRSRRHWRLVDQAFGLLLAPFPTTMRQMLIKDFRNFRRDTMQWSQLAIFGMLLAFYFANIRRLHHGQSNTTWLTMISFLNVGVVGLLLATFTTRFIYPLISLEGRRVWVLGTLPINRREIVTSKFIFAASLAVLPCCLLICLSDFMLGIFACYPKLAVVHQIVCVCLCLGLCGIATGLGALFPNLQESSPAKVASSFGGTLSLVLSAVYILSIVMTTAVPAFYQVRQATGDAVPGWWREGYVNLAIGICVGMAVLATGVSLRLGIRRFQRMEF